MENVTTEKKAFPEATFIRKNKLPIIGFSLMIAGPAIFIIAAQIRNIIGYLSDFPAYVITFVVLFLPGIGAIICIYSLFRWKKIGIAGRVLSILTVIICNPLFYFYYYIFVAFSSSHLTAPPI